MARRTRDWNEGLAQDLRDQEFVAGAVQPCATCVPSYGADTTIERSEGVVSAAGVEREIGAITNLLMARDFWGYRVLSAALAAVRRVH